MSLITSDTKDRTLLFNRIMYSMLLLIGIYFLITQPGDWSVGLSNLGLALAFDPFDQKISWSNRPRYQRAWLLIHMGIIVTLLLIFLVM